MNTADKRRFGGISRLFGRDGFEALNAAHVVIVGLGGVGSWAAEALARTAVGRLTLIDGDIVEESNTNRQMPALEGQYGRLKTEVMAERLRAINPQADIRTVSAFVTTESMDELIPTCDVIIDAIDSLKDKVALIAFAHQRAIPVIVSGGAGGKIDCTAVRSEDLARAIGDPLIGAVRGRLRKEYGFPRGAVKPEQSKRFGIEAVFSDEPVKATQDGEEGFGVFVGVTATFGMLLAQRAVLKILSKQKNLEKTMGN